jgi:hypothetical protein
MSVSAIPAGFASNNLKMAIEIFFIHGWPALGLPHNISVLGELSGLSVRFSHCKQGDNWQRAEIQAGPGWVLCTFIKITCKASDPAAQRV